ncbi:hypothetical protein M758_1G050500 [Ceratodon purpureus]|nr:hypothetical protein M758_1G050500 [Ceratodon purpureus]
MKCHKCALHASTPNRSFNSCLGTIFQLLLNILSTDCWPSTIQVSKYYETKATYTFQKAHHNCGQKRD